MVATVGVRSPLEVLVLDDHRVFAETLAMGIDAQADMRCVATAHSVAEGRHTAAEVGFDVALVDLRLPDAEGLSVIPDLLERRPRAAVVVLTGHLHPDLARRAMAAGARGFLGKDASLAEILNGVRTAVSGRPVLAPSLAEHPVTRLRLTPREQEVLNALCRGQDATSIGAVLGISLHTARDHIRSLLGKLGSRSQLHAVAVARRAGLADEL